MATDDEVEGGGAGWRPPRNVVKKVSGRVRVCVFPSFCDVPVLRGRNAPGLLVLIAALSTSALLKSTAGGGSGSGATASRRDSDSNSNDPAILQGTTLRGGVFRDCLLPRAPTYRTISNNLSCSSTLRDCPSVQST